MVLMTPNSQVSVPLDQLNEIIAQQKGVTVDQLAVTSEDPRAEPVVATVSKDSKSEAPKELTPAEMRSKADALYKQAAILRKQADLLDPKKKKSAEPKEVNSDEFE